MGSTATAIIFWGAKLPPISDPIEDLKEEDEKILSKHGWSWNFCGACDEYQNIIYTKTSYYSVDWECDKLPNYHLSKGIDDHRALKKICTYFNLKTEDIGWHIAVRYF